MLELFLSIHPSSSAFELIILCVGIQLIVWFAIYSSHALILIRQNEQLSKYGDTKSARNIMLVELKKLIEANPLFRDKLAFPTFKASRLRTLINQRLQTIYLSCLLPLVYLFSIATTLSFGLLETVLNFCFWYWYCFYVIIIACFYYSS